MTQTKPQTTEQIRALLDEWLEVEFTFLHTEEPAAALAGLPRREQDFVLGWVRRIASSNIEIAYQFSARVARLLDRMDRQVIEAWALHAMDVYDRSGLRPGLLVIHEVEDFLRQHQERRVGAVFDEVRGVLQTFIQGLSGRRLHLESATTGYTDSETLFLPTVLATQATPEENFLLYKIMATLLWAQTRFGTFRCGLHETLRNHPDPERALHLFHALETLRLKACIGRELPGLRRAMLRLDRKLGLDRLSAPWDACSRALSTPAARAGDTLDWLERLHDTDIPPPVFPYAGELRPELVEVVMEKRIEREKILLRVRLGEMLEDLERKRGEAREPPDRFGLAPAQNHDQDGEPGRLELTLDDAPIAPPGEVRQLMTSIQLDLGEIPDDYLVPAGPGEYDPAQYLEPRADPEAVWSGTYHEEGAHLYQEWDCGRQHYRKDWCVLREKDVSPVHDDFVATTLTKYGNLIKHLRKTFEAMRGEDRLLKRQIHGDDIDIDALIEALADSRDGSEMSDHLFTRMHREERNIAVMFMVDMSGSTKGWINDAERESLVLLCEALETLGDRYAIYGFSGMTRKRCELYRIKTFDEAYGADVQARISGIRPQDYTRMGVTIRHLSRLLNEIEARTRILITLSDGKPDDYNDYRGEYGIEDTRRALIEARRDGIHPYCITIDERARDYLPHLYGPAAYTVVDEVAALPRKVADIYRKLTT